MTQESQKDELSSPDKSSAEKRERDELDLDSGETEAWLIFLNNKNVHTLAIYNGELVSIDKQRSEKGQDMVVVHTVEDFGKSPGEEKKVPEDVREGVTFRREDIVPPEEFVFELYKKQFIKFLEAKVGVYSSDDLTAIIADMEHAVDEMKVLEPHYKISEGSKKKKQAVDKLRTMVGELYGIQGDLIGKEALGHLSQAA